MGWYIANCVLREGSSLFYKCIRNIYVKIIYLYKLRVMLNNLLCNSYLPKFKIGNIAQFLKGGGRFY